MHNTILYEIFIKEGFTMNIKHTYRIDFQDKVASLSLSL